MKEVTWKNSNEFPDYSVSDTGLVRRNTANGNGGLCMAGRIIKGYTGANGYERFTMYVAGRKVYRNGHQLVAAAFIGPPNGLQVNHINGSKADNRLENLEYVTASQNIRHAYATGLARGMPGESNPRAVLTRESAEAIRFLHRNGFSKEFIARAMRTGTSKVALIVSGDLWKVTP